MGRKESNQTKDLQGFFFLHFSTVQLNGTPLKMLSDTQLPILLPRKQNAPVFLPKYTFGFVVLPDVRLQICL